MEKTRKFYKEILELELIAEERDTLIFDLNATELRISKIENFKPQLFTVLGWSVDKIEDKIDKLRGKRVSFIDYPMFDQDDRGIVKFGGAKIAYFEDPSGNNLSLTEF